MCDAQTLWSAACLQQTFACFHLVDAGKLRRVVIFYEPSLATDEEVEDVVVLYDSTPAQLYNTLYPSGIADIRSKGTPLGEAIKLDEIKFQEGMQYIVRLAWPVLDTMWVTFDLLFKLW